MQNELSKDEYNPQMYTNVLGEVAKYDVPDVTRVDSTVLRPKVIDTDDTEPPPSEDSCQTTQTEMISTNIISQPSTLFLLGVGVVAIVSISIFVALAVGFLIL